MTKITKLFAIVLCLALVLGTTAMAAPMTSPTNILGVEDFESYAVTSDSTTLGAFYNYSNATSAEVPTTLRDTVANIRIAHPLGNGFNWFTHRGAKMGIAAGNGGKVATFTSDLWYVAELAYLLDNPFTYDISTTDNKALVFSTDMALVSGNKTAMDYWGGLGYIYTRKDTSGISYTGASNAFGLVAYDPDGSSGPLGYKATPAPASYTPGTGGYGYILAGPEYAHDYGEFVNMKRVFGPFRLTGSAPTGTDVANEMYYDYTALRSLQIYDHHSVRLPEDGGLSIITTASNYDATAIHTVAVTNSQRYNGEHYDNIRIYEISLNPEHFYVVEQTDGRYTEIGLNDEIKIYFSQPIVDCGDLSAATFKTSDITKTTVITDSQSNVYDADDFTATISDEIVGDQVQGVLTIKMNQPMNYSETYTITLPSLIRNVARVKMPAASNRTITVTTLPTPTYSFSFAEDTSAFTNSYKKFDVNATSLSARETDSIILIGVYDALGNIQSYSFVSASFSPSSQEALSLSAQVAAGSQVRAYACGEKDQIATLDTYSYSAATPIEIQ